MPPKTAPPAACWRAGFPFVSCRSTRRGGGRRACGTRWNASRDEVNLPHERGEEQWDKYDSIAEDSESNDGLHSEHREGLGRVDGRPALSSGDEDDLTEFDTEAQFEDEPTLYEDPSDRRGRFDQRVFIRDDGSWVDEIEGDEGTGTWDEPAGRVGIEEVGYSQPTPLVAFTGEQNPDARVLIEFDGTWDVEEQAEEWEGDEGYDEEHLEYARELEKDLIDDLEEEIEFSTRKRYRKRAPARGRQPAGDWHESSAVRASGRTSSSMQEPDQTLNNDAGFLEEDVDLSASEQQRWGLRHIFRVEDFAPPYPDFSRPLDEDDFLPPRPYFAHSDRSLSRYYYEPDAADEFIKESLDDNGDMGEARQEDLASLDMWRASSSMLHYSKYDKEEAKLFLSESYMEDGRSSPTELEALTKYRVLRTRVKETRFTDEDLLVYARAVARAFGENPTTLKYKSLFYSCHGVVFVNSKRERVMCPVGPEVIKRALQQELDELSDDRREDLKFFRESPFLQGYAGSKRADNEHMEALLEEYIRHIPHWTTLQKRFKQWRGVWKRAGIFLNDKGQAMLQMSSRFSENDLLVRINCAGLSGTDPNLSICRLCFMISAL